MADTRPKRVAPAARAAWAKASTASTSTARKAACEPAVLIVVPRAQKAQSTGGKAWLMPSAL